MGLEDRPYLSGNEYGSPYGSRVRGMTWVTRIVILNAVIWILDSIPGLSLTDWFCLDTDLFRTHFKVYTLLTCGFLHAPLNSSDGLFHILGNMFTLWFLGRQIEYKLGSKEFLRFYLLSIVIASLGWYLTTLLSQPPTSAQLIAAGKPPFVPSVVGASGGVSAVLMLFVFSYPKQPISIWGVIELPAWVVGVLFVGMDIVRAIGMPNSGIAFSAHLAGAGFGAAYHYFHWNFAFLAAPFAGLSLKRLGQPKLKVHRPSRNDEDKLADQADRVLDKLHREGEASLTSKERKVLEAYSRKVRKNRSD